jgi:hypothetical protein
MTHFIKIGFSFSNAFSYKSIDFKILFQEVEYQRKEVGWSRKNW